jgi:hypothetical protein
MLGSINLTPPFALVVVRADPSATSLVAIGRMTFIGQFLSSGAPRFWSGAKAIEGQRNPISELYLDYICSTRCVE